MAPSRRHRGATRPWFRPQQQETRGRICATEHPFGLVVVSPLTASAHDGSLAHDRPLGADTDARPCGCPKSCRGWSGGISVLVDESATAGRFYDLEVPNSARDLTWVNAAAWPHAVARPHQIRFAIPEIRYSVLVIDSTRAAPEAAATRPGVVKSRETRSEIRQNAF